MSKKYVLSCVNGHAPSQSVIDYGCWLAKSMNSGLKLFHAIDNQYHENTADLSGSIGLGAREEMLEEIVSIEHEQNKLIQKKAKLILDSAKLHAEKCGVKDLNICLRKGRVIDNILDLKDELSITVIGKYGKNHQGASSDETPVGHKVEGIVKKVDLPLLIVSEDYSEPKSILFSYDGSEGSKKVLNFLCLEFQNHEVSIELVFFGDKNEETQKMLLDAKEKLENSKYKVNEQIITDSIGNSLSDYLLESDCDILAMGAFGHGLLHKLFVGSFTSEMIRKSKKPILLVR